MGIDELHHRNMDDTLTSICFARSHTNIFDLFQSTKPIQTNVQKIWNSSIICVICSNSIVPYFHESIKLLRKKQHEMLIII